MDKDFKEVVGRYTKLIVSHFVKHDYEITSEKVKEAINALIGFRHMCDTAEDCLMHLYPPKK